jgi:alpha/beta superfamily hydrolase
MDPSSFENVNPGDVRVDSATGIQERVRFVGRGSERRFVCTHVPASEPTAGVVICSPTFAELQVTYRREVLTARELAARGFAVQRFHYRGSGNSDGSTEGAEFSTLVADAQFAAECLVQSTGVRPTVFLGTRIGALVAARAARLVGASGLVLWSPVLDTAVYFREVFRAHMIGRLKDGAVNRGSVQDPVDEIRREGHVDVLGYPIGKAFYESFLNRGLAAEIRGTSSMVLLLQVGGNGLHSDNSRFTRQLRNQGVSVDSSVVDGTDVWWFGGGAALREGESETTREIMTTTVDWIEGLSSGSRDGG